MIIVLAVSGLVAFGVGAGAAFVLSRYLHRGYIFGLLALLIAASVHQYIESLGVDEFEGAGAQVVLIVLLLPALFGCLLVTVVGLRR